jgi:peptidoglycan/xylan/chitin deacetylase (PgdA/CDA1 family)
LKTITIKRFFITVLVIMLASAVIWPGIQNTRESLAAHVFSAPPVNTGAIEIPVLMYHKVNSDPRTGGPGIRVTPARFERQMRYLANNGYHTVSLTDLVAFIEKNEALPPRPVVITFDDGYLDNYRHAFPVLKKYGFTATIFVVANYVGKTNGFDVRAGLQPVNQMAGWEELEQMGGYGIVIGSHTMDHPSLTRLSLSKARYQIENSKSVLEERLGRPVEVFSYPYGSYNDRLAQMVKEGGYLASVTTDQGLVTHNSNPYVLKRIRILGAYDMQRFVQELESSRWPSAK